MEDLRPGSAVGEKGKKKIFGKHWLPSQTERKIEETNKLDGTEMNQASSLEVVSGTGRREVLRMRRR